MQHNAPYVRFSDLEGGVYGDAAADGTSLGFGIVSITVVALISHSLVMTPW